MNEWLVRSACKRHQTRALSSEFSIKEEIRLENVHISCDPRIEP